ncbi:two component response regulator [Legionella busanensis]|uniref:Two component response regulator n=1 Tax=Legionella busanensis TaxID=190655 RepID=A0A378JQ92_9GAMM|nr:response regulator [Legionella busanensis]STX52100.1 two component response regulator [Legionella busanensis]
MKSINPNIDILCVEDDEIDVQSVKRAFNKLNSKLKIAIASNGKQALDKLYGQNGEEKIYPKVILLDINMPKMNGIEFLQALRADLAFIDIQVFVLTGSYTTKEKLAMESLNIRGHIIKPLEYSDALNIFWALEST